MRYFKTAAVLHSYTEVPEDKKFAAFRAACEGGGTSPDWTKLGDDPSAWKSPADAAGGLILFGRHGAPLAVQPTSDDAMAAIDAALDVAEEVGIPAHEVTAAYFSCGGQGIFLVQSAVNGQSSVMVARPEPCPRRGAREDELERMGFEPVVYTCDEQCEVCA